jgi:hypothetical protein
MGPGILFSQPSGVVFLRAIKRQNQAFFIIFVTIFSAVCDPELVGRSGTFDLE